MHLVAALAAGIRGAEGGVAEIYERTGETRTTWYRDHGGTSPDATGADVRLDQHGSAHVYVNETARIIVRSFEGTVVRSFTVGAESTAVTYQGQSFTGRDYVTNASAAGEPTTLREALDLWVANSGAADFEAMVGADAEGLSEAIAGLGIGLVSVKDPRFGAKGDGMTDDTDAIQAAFNYTHSLGTSLGTAGTCYFPPGDYCVSTVQPTPYCRVMGAGSGETKLLAISLGQSLYVNGIAGPSTMPVIISDIGFGTTDNISSYAGYVSEAGGVANFWSNPIRLERCAFFDGASVYLVGSGPVLLSECSIEHYNTPTTSGSLTIQNSSQIRLLGSRFTVSPSATALGTLYLCNMYGAANGMAIVHGCIFDYSGAPELPYSVVALGLFAGSAECPMAVSGTTANRHTGSTVPSYIVTTTPMNQIAESGSQACRPTASPAWYGTSFGWASAYGLGAQVSFATPQLAIERMSTSAADPIPNSKGAAYRQLVSAAALGYTSTILAHDGAELGIYTENKSGGVSGTVSYNSAAFACGGAGATIANNSFTFASCIMLNVSAGPRMVVCALRENVT